MNETAIPAASGRAHAEPFHEWPLAVFTTLAIMGAGTLTAPLVAGLVAGSTAAAAPVIHLGALLLGAGFAVSIAHLGRPLRAPIAAWRFGRSWLSTEVVLGGATLVVGLFLAVLPHVLPALNLVGALLAAAFLVSLGLVYRLPGQYTWHGAVVATPAVTGIGFGALALAAAWDGAVASVGAVAALLLAADTVLFIIRRLRLMWPPGPFTAAHPALFEHRQALLAARFLMVDVLPGVLVLSALPKGAAGALGVGILLDRLMFYGFAAQHTTEAEIGRAEDAM